MLQFHQTSPPFSLLVTLQFTDERYKAQFLEDFAPLAAYIRDNEPLTLAYEALQSDQDPLKILILERYVDKENAFLQVHRSSQPFLEFRPKLKSMQDAGFVTVEGSSYDDTMLGFGDRSYSKNKSTRFPN
jgi:quinol monooxygenase YgiN